MYAERFRVQFAMYRTDADLGRLQVVFNGIDQDDYDSVTIRHSSTVAAPSGTETIDGDLPVGVTGTGTSGNVPTRGQSDAMWVRVQYDGTNLTVRCATTSGGLASASDCYSSSDFDFASGLVGFAPVDSAMADDFTLQTDRDNNGSYETTELIDAFTIDASGYTDAQPTHDAAGNLTYDGVFTYTYDAWNRLTKVTKAYRDPSSGDVALGSVTAEYKYDALHRRIVREVKNSADLDATYHDYYDGQSVVETRNGSDAVLKQQAWGVTYIDELVQIAINGDPVDDPEFDPADGDHDPAYYYAVHNANYNVQLLLDAAGSVIERYEYAPYGERQVYISPGSNDPDCHAPTLLPQRVKVAGTSQPYAINDTGFQGRPHDDVTGNIDHRTRVWSTRFAQWNQNDIWYLDGMSRRAGYHVMHGGLDPSGSQNVFGSQFKAGASALSKYFGRLQYFWVQTDLRTTYGEYALQAPGAIVLPECNELWKNRLYVKWEHVITKVDNDLHVENRPRASFDLAPGMHHLPFEYKRTTKTIVYGQWVGVNYACRCENGEYSWKRTDLKLVLQEHMVVTIEIVERQLARDPETDYIMFVYRTDQEFKDGYRHTGLRVHH